MSTLKFKKTLNKKAVDHIDCSDALSFSRVDSCGNKINFYRAACFEKNPDKKFISIGIEIRGIEDDPVAALYFKEEDAMEMVNKLVDLINYKGHDAYLNRLCEELEEIGIPKYVPNE